MLFGKRISVKLQHSYLSTRTSLDLIFRHAFVAKYQPHLVQIITVIMVYLLSLAARHKFSSKSSKFLDSFPVGHIVYIGNGSFRP